jgi:hypothetical protein
MGGVIAFRDHAIATNFNVKNEPFPSKRLSQPFIASGPIQLTLTENAPKTKRPPKSSGLGKNHCFVALTV